MATRTFPDGPPAREPGHSRYSTVAIAFHWTIAVLLIANLVVGLWVLDPLLDSADPALKKLGGLAIMLHKSTGLTILALAVARLAWRLSHTPPPYPAHMGAAQRAAAMASHWGFYILMLALPLSGWVMSSTGKTLRPINWFNLFEVPHLPLAKSLNDPAHAAHLWLGWIALAMIVLHVAAALKHHFIDRDDVLTRMWVRRA